MSILFPEYLYVDTAFGGVKARNHPAPILAVVKKKLQTEGYMTVFRFDASYLEHCKSTGSVTGYRGKCYADYLPLDIDKEGDLEGAWRDAIQLAIHLQDSYEVGSTQIRYYFSGHKGYHLLLPTQLLGEIEPSETLPQEFRTFAARIASEAKVSIDEKIYDMNRLFRLPNTIHATSKLHKIELSYDEFILETPKTHKALAQQTRNIAFLPHDLEINPSLAELFSKPAEKRKLSPDADWVLSFSPDEKLARSLINTLAYAYAPGQRHAVTLALAGYCAKHKIPIGLVLEVIGHLAAGDPEHDDRERAVCDTYRKVDDGVDVRGYKDLVDYLSPGDLAELTHLVEGDRNGAKETPGSQSTTDIPDETSEETAPADARRSLRDVNHWNVTPVVPLVDGLIAKGTLVYIAGETQASKTLFSLYLLMHLVTGKTFLDRFTVTPQKKILYLVLEDPDRRIHARLLDVQHEFDGFHQSGDCDFYFLPRFILKGKGVTQLRSMIEQNSYDTVWLDTYQRATPGIASFDDEQQSTIIHGLAAMTREIGTTLVIIDHVRKADNKTAGLKRPELSIEDIKGSGTKAQNADTVILLQKRKDAEIRFACDSKDFDPVRLTLKLSPQNSGKPKYTVFDTDELGRRSTQVGDANTELVYSHIPDDPGVPVSFADLVKAAGLSESTVSKHVKTLRDQKRISSHKMGRTTHYCRNTSDLFSEYDDPSRSDPVDD